MSLIQWNDSFSVNVVEIDIQHRKLIAMINDLSDAMRQGKGKHIMGKIVKQLFEYTEIHFRTEEKYFDQYGYPEARSHKKEHSDFIRTVDKFKNEFETGKLTLSIAVMNFLSDWLQTHIMGTDRKYGLFFNEKGLK